MARTAGEHSKYSSFPYYYYHYHSPSLLRACLGRQLEKTLRARAVLPNAIEVPLSRGAEVQLLRL